MPYVILQFNIFMTRVVYVFAACIPRSWVMRSTEAEFLDEIQTKV
jgi:hypothetical protein